MKEEVEGEVVELHPHPLTTLTLKRVRRKQTLKTQDVKKNNNNNKP